MGGVVRAFGVGAVECVTADVVQMGHFFGLEQPVGGFERGVVVVVELGLGGGDPRVREATVFDEDDGCRGVLGAQLLHQRHAFGRHIGRLHVRGAVDDNGRGIELVDQVADGGVHATVAGEAEVDDRAIKSAAQDGRVHHAGAGGVRAVRDRGAVEDDRLVFSRSEALELRTGWHADLQLLDAVVKRQVGGEFVLAWGQSADHHGFDMLLVRLRAGDPAPLALFITRVQVQPAHARRRHGWHRDACVHKIVAAVDGVRVRLEAHHHARAVTAKAPNGGRHRLLRLGRKTIKPALPLLIPPATAFHAPFCYVVPLCIRRNGGHLRFGRGLGRGGLSEQRAADE